MKKQLLIELNKAVEAEKDKIREKYSAIDKLHEDLKRSQREKNT